MVWRLIRWSLALLLVWAAYKLFRFGVAQGIGPVALASLLAVFGCLILATILFLPESVPIASRPFTAMIDSVYGTGRGKGRPPYDCMLARGYARQFRYEEALIEFGRMRRLYPRELEPYRESIVILLREFGDREEATRILHQGLRKIRGKEDCTELQDLFNEGMLRLAAEEREREGGPGA